MGKVATLSMSLLVAMALWGCGAQPQQVSEPDAAEEEQAAEVVYRNDLRDAISEAESIDLNGFTDESSAGLQTELDRARNTLASKTASQEAVDESVERLRSAMDALVEYPEEDKSQLRAVVDEASALNASDYESDSLSRLEDAVSSARVVLGNRRATREEIDAATASVREAIDSLEPAPTVSQLNALAMAQSYLKSMPFSHDGLVEQLEFEGFSGEDATYGADHCGADWNVQAERMAASYLESMPFSRSGLIEQLEFEGFTYDQAVHGVDTTGL